jgi:glycosyltransferase involved in cell wall biosynthesis
MKILEVLTYYRPHVSGLTIYVERLSQALARQGHEVTIFTSQYDPMLPVTEFQEGVKVVRVPVAFRVSKGVIMPTFGPKAWSMVREADVVHLHLPQFDAPGVALRGRLTGKPVVLTYHSDLRLPEGLLNRVVDRVVGVMNRAAGQLADAVVAYTYDFATHSPFLSRYLGSKLQVIPPPVEVTSVTPEKIAQFSRRHDLHGQQVIGIAGRLAAEKGIEVLLNALPEVLQAHPKVRVLHAGPFENVLGEEAYAARLAPLLERYRDHYTLLGTLEGDELTAFYRNLDCLVMCSLNSTETFGLVQVEAMINGVPAVASNLPGVRQPVEMTGMGEIAAVGDAHDLARAIVKILENKNSYIRPPEDIARSFSPDQTALEYLALFDGLRQGSKPPLTDEPEAYTHLRQLRDAA